MSEATSPDGRVRVVTYDDGGGVFVFADFADQIPRPKKVRFLRGKIGASVDELVPVRSGNDAWAPGGSAVAFDREALSGELSVWYAIPVTRVGGVYVDGPITLGAPIIAPGPDLVTDVWLKSLAVPTDARLEAWGPDPVGRLAGRDAGQPRPGSSYPSGGWDVPIYQPFALTFRTYTHADYFALEQLVSYGPMLLQTIPMYGIPDQYVKLGSLDWAYLSAALNPEREVTITFNPCARPPTINAPMLVPGRTFDLVAASYASFNQIVADLDQFYDLLIVAPPPPDELIPESGGSGDEGTI